MVIYSTLYTSLYLLVTMHISIQKKQYIGELFRVYTNPNPLSFNETHFP